MLTLKLLAYDRRVWLLLGLIIIVVTGCNDPWDGQRRWTPGR